MLKISKCPTCGDEHRNPIFCSRKCAGYGNKHNSKIRIIRYCKYCNVFIGKGYYAKKVCVNCNKNFKKWDCITLAEFKKNRTTSNAHGRLREIARTIYKSNNPIVKCDSCGYSKYTEICHIKAVSKFKDTATIGEINDLSNLKQLCRNCHWEFDHQ